jgi:aspartyl/glutamyl-tRNA(Asn/Gln) amidotransferase C subunit
MTEELSVEVFQRLVQLAALELDETESEYLRKQLINQLKSIEELSSIPVEESIPPARHGVSFPKDISPALRPDKWIPYPNPDDILAQAPQTEERYYVVPEIPHTKLD